MSQLPKYNSEQKRHRLRLLNISKKLTKEDLEGLLYLIQDILPKDAAEKIDSGIKLFQQLENKGYLGLNDYTQLKSWLEEVERNDLAKLLPKDSDLQAAHYNPSVQQKIEESHRFLLISVSNSFGVRDLYQLCYLCALPKSTVDGITEAYQLFEELEKQDRLGPGNYGFLQKCLRSIGREDLAGMFKQPSAVDIMVPDIPNCLKGIAQTITVLCRSRCAMYASKTRSVRELSSHQLDSFWRKLIEQPCGETFLTLKMDLPDWWQPDMRDDCSASDVNSIIDSSLTSIFAFAAADLESLQSGFPFVDTPQSRQPFHDCYRCYAKFDQAVERVQWNSKIRQKVQQMYSKKECPIGKAAREACHCIQAVCKDFLWEENVQEDIHRVEDTFHMLESFYYIQWLRELMFQWMSTLIHLASNVQLDLRPHLSMLIKSLMQHKDGITQYSDALSSIIGQGVLDQLMPTLLSDGIPQQQHSDACVSRSCTLSAGMSWYVFLLELSALAMGCTINPQKISEKYFEQFHHGEKYENMICGAIQLGHVLVSKMYSEVRGLRKTVLGLTSSEPLRTLIQELLPEESDMSSDSV